MRKLKLQVQLSVDGFHSGPNGEMDWMTFATDDKIKNVIYDILDPVDTILLGRKMTDEFITYWQKVVLDENHEWYGLAMKLIETPKVVFTKTMSASPWQNTSLATGEIVREIKKLKSSDGGDIIVYGGTEFVSSLIKHDLIDEYYLVINPTAIGNGKTIFSQLPTHRKLELKRSIAFDCGKVLIQYTPITN